MEREGFTGNVNGLLRTVLACRVANTFSSHCSLVRPLGAGGKRLLSNDLNAVIECLVRLNPLQSGRSSESKDHEIFTELKAVDKIFLKSVTRGKDEHDGDGSVTTTKEFMQACMGVSPVIRPSVFWHHVITRGPPQLQLPHRRRGWSIVRYLVRVFVVVVFCCFLLFWFFEIFFCDLFFCVFVIEKKLTSLFTSSSSSSSSSLSLSHIQTTHHYITYRRHTLNRVDVMSQVKEIKQKLISSKYF